MKKRGTRGQLTIFIIVAIVVVAIVALLFAIPKLRTSVGFEKPLSPENFIQTCLEDTIKENVELISLQGGSLEPSPSILYQDICLTTNEFNKLKNKITIVQQAVKEGIEIK